MVDRPWKIFGPVLMDRHDERSWKNLFCDTAVSVEGIADARGVYVIGTVGRGGDHIRYIGMTGRQSFATEMFTPHKLANVWDKLEERGQARQVKVWLFAKRSPKGSGFSNDRRLERQAFLLESLLIMYARAAGHQLVNIQKMKSAIGMSVDGLFGHQGPGRKSRVSSEFANLLGFVDID